MHHLDISNCNAIEDFSPLTEIPNLEELTYIGTTIPEEILAELANRGVELISEEKAEE